MKTNILIVLVLVLATAAYTYFTNSQTAAPREVAKLQPLSAPAIRQGAPAPDVAYTALNGKKGRLSDFKGKAVILNFWASWCTPCVAEFPALLTLAATFPDDAVLIAVSSDHDRAMMDRFLAKLKKENGSKATAGNVIIVWDEDKSITQDQFQTLRLPETILIDSNGIMQDKIAGLTDWNDVAMIQKIRGYQNQNR